MSDIERRLREVGERARSDQPAAHLPPQVTRRVKRRRLATVATSVLVTAALAFGGAVAVGAFEPPREIGPAEPTNDVLIHYHRTGGFAGEDVRLTVRTDGTASLTTVEDGETTTTEHDVRDADLRKVKVAVDAVDWPAAAAERRFGPVVAADAVQFELRHEDFAVSGEAGAAPTTVAALLRRLDGLVDALTPTPTVRSCVGRIDFAPTYLPDGWMAQLQLGGGGGFEFPGARGHYGNGLDAGTRGKARGGFADLVEGASPYAQGNREEIEVLGSSASLGDIHEGFSVEFIHKGCDLVLVAYGIGREELARFARGLRVSDKRSDEGSSGGVFPAFWPEDTREAAKQACADAAKEDGSHDGEGEDVVSYRLDPESVVLEFGYEVLGWEQAVAVERSGDRGFRPDRIVFELRRGDDQGASPRSPSVIVDATEPFSDCWSVSSVSRMPDREPTGFSVGVDGRDVRVGVDPLGATSLSIEVGYAGRKVSETGIAGEKGFAEFQLDFDPDTPGYALVLFLDENGQVFSAASARWPAGDFAAG